MNWDDDKPKPPKGAQIGDSLETLSVAELQARITLLHTEVERVSAELARKRAHEAAAAKLFKS